MNILVINAGSSSLKYQLIDMSNEKVLAKGLCEKIGIGGKITHKTFDGYKDEHEANFPTHSEAFQELVKVLSTGEHAVIKDKSDIGAIGHRVVQGGTKFSASVKITEDVIAGAEEFSDLAPLHNPACIAGIRACQQVFSSDIPQVAVFDTAFHQTMPEKAYIYPFPYEYFEKYSIRKYGFHGTSHKFVAKRGAELAGLDFGHAKIITCHIGNGGSVTAVLDGKSFDTSMGFSPLDGLVMGTRCGQVDASAITFIGAKEGMSYAELDSMMNKRSGVLGLTGLSSDMRDIDRAYDEGNERAITARDMYYGRIKKFVGQYAAEMGGVDLIVFTGGVGENSSEMREYVCSGLEFMGVRFDREANKGARGVDKILSAADSKVKVAVVATDEELVIATDTYNLVK